MKSESRIQQDCFVWYNNNYCLPHHQPREMIFHIANENQHRLTSIGVVAGVADLFCTISGQPVFVEVKDAKGKQSPKQVKFQAHCKDVGIPYHIVRSLEEFQKIVCK